MLRLDLLRECGPEVKILCLGAHCDDIEIGCGGTILALLEREITVDVLWAVFSSDGDRAREARESAQGFLGRARSTNVVINTFRNSFFPYLGTAVKEAVEALRASFSPDVIFTHCRGDLHQDHRVISELTWNAFRDHLILEYEIPKYDGDLGTPNVFVPLDEQICRRKVELIVKSFPSQSDKQWFGEDTFWAMLRLRGIEAYSKTKYAEAFYGRKVSVR